MALKFANPNTFSQQSYACATDTIYFFGINPIQLQDLYARNATLAER